MNWRFTLMSAPSGADLTITLLISAAGGSPRSLPGEVNSQRSRFAAASSVEGLLRSLLFRVINFSTN